MEIRTRIKATAGAALLTILIPHVVAAQERPMLTPERSRTTLILPTAALAAGVAVDVVSTRQAFARGCHEGNTMLYGVRPSTSRLLGVKAATAGAGFAVMYFAHKTGHDKIARLFGYAAAGAQGAAGVLNTRCGR